MIHSLLALLVTVTTLQTTVPIPSVYQPLPLDKRFDFWLGKWHATWTNPGGSIGKRFFYVML